MPKTYRYQSIDEVLTHCHRSFSLPLMMCDCSSAPRMLTSLQHQRTYCVFRMIMNLAVVVSVMVLCIAPSAHAQSCMLPDCFVNGTAEILCSSCPVGFGVEVKNRELMLCSNSPPRNTKCEPCIAGVNFSDTNDLEKQCSECLGCHGKKEVEIKECTPESDRQCICKEGLFYYKDGPDTCVSCTTCGEDEEETRPCTPTEDRACGPRTAPTVTTTPVPLTTNQTMSNVSTSPPDTGMSTKPETGGKPLSIGAIVAIVIGVVVVVAIIVCIVLYRRGLKCTRDTWTGGEGGGGSPLTFNCCIGSQTNKYNNPIPAVSMIGVSGSNGTAHYQQVPDAERNGDVGRQPNGDVGRQPNGDVGRQPIGDVGRQPIGDVGRQPNGVIARQHSATSSTTEETEHQQSVEDALGFSAERLERVIRQLDAHDQVGRNALMLAGEHLSPGTCDLLASSNTQASDVLKMWVRQGKTKADLIRALRAMERDDVANICEEAGS